MTTNPPKPGTIFLPPKPDPDGSPRLKRSKAIRREASEEISRSEVATRTNEEATKYSNVWPTNFTKGLPHNSDGIVDPAAFPLLFDAINEVDNADSVFAFDVPLGPFKAEKSHRPDGYRDSVNINKFLTNENAEVRSWESPRAGHVYDLEGPDAGSVGIASAPNLGSDELVAEMAENYAMALLRDCTFEEIRDAQGPAKATVEALNKLPWFDRDEAIVDVDNNEPTIFSRRRRQARFAEGDKKLTTRSLFRGSSPGCMDGPYISQFLLIGNASRTNPAHENETQVKAAGQRNGGYAVTTSFCRVEKVAKGDQLEETFEPNKVENGYIIYGAQRVDQRVGSQKKQLDHMTDWATWLDVQNGADFRGDDRFESSLRFVTTPRDLATYVHFDALYQAYLNACLILLGVGAKTDSGLPETMHKTRTAFATFGGPHILTLVTETATRSLKAVRRQKFNFHMRARPEVVAAMTALVASDRSEALQSAEADVKTHLEKLQDARSNSYSLLEKINEHNNVQNERWNRKTDYEGLPNVDNCNYLLPMAFPEGSPMHPAYGAGHATVAGSCTTILKAFFQMFNTDEGWDRQTLAEVGDGKQLEQLYVPTANGQKLTPTDGASTVTLECELNKLAANISIGRNMAGVHYYSDYYDSLRMGERIAIGMLEEQMATYTEPVSMRLTSFDGDRITLSNTLENTGASNYLKIEDSVGNPVDVNKWYTRHIGDAT